MPGASAFHHPRDMGAGLQNGLFDDGRLFGIARRGDRHRDRMQIARPVAKGDANGADAIAIGNSAVNTFQDATVVGSSATASGANALAPR